MYNLGTQSNEHNKYQKPQMLQTATLAYNTSPPNPGLSTLHPNNTSNKNGRIISRSPNPIPMVDLRSLSPNKLNATKKPMVSGGGANLGNGKVMLPAGFGGRRGNLSPSGHVGNFANVFQNLQVNSGREPLLSSKGPKVMQYDAAAFCQNHPNKTADFVTRLDNQQIGYCQKCAINLASKGFTVSRKSDPLLYPKSAAIQHPRFEPFSAPHLSHMAGYSQLHNLIEKLDATHSAYVSQLQKYLNIQDHYNNQYAITENFYTQLINTIHQMKSDHLADLTNQAKKHYQLALIKQDHLRPQLQEMEVIRADLVGSLEIILEDFGSSVVQSSLNFYKQQVFNYKDRIQDEIAEFAKIVIDENVHELNHKLKKIQDFLIDVWNQKQQQSPPPTAISNKAHKPQPAVQQKSPRSVKHLLNLHPKGEVEPKQAACRQLFEDEEEVVEEKNIGGGHGAGNQDLGRVGGGNEANEEFCGQSPQFKNI